MYSQKVTNAALNQAERQLKLHLRRHPLAYVESAVKSLDALMQEDGNLRRPLTPDERAFIRNERIVCKLDYNYWRSRYAWIKHYSENRYVRYEPNIAQRMMNDIRAEMEEEGIAIFIQQLKSRQLGATTDTEMCIAHRVQFYHNVNAVVASSRPEKSEEMSDKMSDCWSRQPWWLLPRQTSSRAGSLIEFGDLNSFVSIQHGAQLTGIARGTTPNVVHLSELCEFDNPEELVDASLMRAVHHSPFTFFVMESTALGEGNWWHNTWLLSKEGWPSRTADFRPIFLPWFVGADIYPDTTWLRAHPVPPGWSPLSLSESHRSRCEEYVQANDLLRKHLGSDWHLPDHQLWWWEVQRNIAVKKKELPQFYMECIAAGSRVSTTDGIVPIEEVYPGTFTEKGRVLARLPKGKRSAVSIRTERGRNLVCTPEHLCRTTKGWIAAADLTLGHVLTLSAPKFSAEYYTAKWKWTPACEMSIVIDETWGRWLGYYMGDGCFNSDTVEFSCAARDPEIASDVSELSREIIGRSPASNRKGGVVRVRSSSIRWWEMLWNLGALQHRYHANLGRNCGYKRKVCVPECIWRSPRSVVREFLRGLFEADGCAHTFAVQISFYAKDEKFIQDVQLLLLGFGINSRFRNVSRKNKAGKVFSGNSLWLNAESAEVFYREIGFVSARKEGGKRYASKKKGRQRDPNDMLDKVASVTPCGDAEVYDITVETSQCFGANGILVHNCPGDDIECFQSRNISVFDTDTVEVLRDSTRNPLAVFGFTGNQDYFPLRNQPDAREIDSDSPPLHIRARLSPTQSPIDCDLIPLKFSGYSSYNEMGKLIVWEMPEEGEDYGIGIDTSEGIGQDRSVMEVLRKGTYSRNDSQVAEFATPRMNSIDIFPYAFVLGCLYSTAIPDGGTRRPRFVVECRWNGENVQLELQKRGWPNFHKWTRYHKTKYNLSTERNIGWYSNAWSRPMMMDYFIKAVRDGYLECPSPYLVDELRHLEADENMQDARAAYGYHDDRAMALGIVFFSLHILEMDGTMRPMRDRRLQDAEGRKERAPVYAPPFQSRDLSDASGSDIWLPEHERDDARERDDEEN